MHVNVQKHKRSKKEHLNAALGGQGSYKSGLVALSPAPEGDGPQVLTSRHCWFQLRVSRIVTMAIIILIIVLIYGNTTVLYYPYF